MRQHSHTQRRPPPMPRLHRPPQPTEAEFRAARDRADLLEAAQWGYQAKDPATLGVAIQRLRTAAQPDDAEQFQDRRGPYEAQHRTDCANLARRLAELQQRGIPQHTVETPSVDVNQLFPSQYLKAADLQGRTVEVTIKDVRIEDVGGEDKPVMHFQGKDRGLVLNRINTGIVAAAYGSDTDGWLGKRLQVYPDKTQFQGRLVDCLRVRVPAPPPPADGSDSDVPW